MAGFEKTAKTPRVGRFPPPRRGPGRRSRLGLLTAQDAARRSSPPRPQRGPRRRRRPFIRIYSILRAFTFLVGLIRIGYMLQVFWGK